MTRIFLSFDYELIWGVFGNVSREYIKNNVLNANDAAILLARLNHELSIPASWALVGAALDDGPLNERIRTCQNLGARVEGLEDLLKHLSVTDRARLSTVEMKFIELVLQSPDQELACHTYSHLFADEVTYEQIEKDLAKFKEIIRIHGFSSEMTFIAPKNKVTDDIIRAVKSAGFINIRVNPANWLYRHKERGTVSGFLTRLLRYADSFLPINELFELAGRSSEPSGILIEGNFFFRPVFKLGILDALHFQRFKLWVWFARKTGRDIHVWTHPHNFGADLKRAVKNYQRMVKYIKALSKSNDIPFLRTSQAFS